MKDALRLLTEFCEECFARKNIQGALALLAQDAVLAGLPCCENAEGAGQARAALENACLPDMEIIRLDGKSIGKNSALLRLDAVFAGGREEGYTITASAATEDGELKLCLIHASSVIDKEIRDVLENVSCGIGICRVTKDAKLEIRHLNDGYFKMCEDEPEALLNRYQSDIVSGIHPGDREMVQANLDDLVKNKRSHEMTYRFITKNGGQKWIYVNTKAIRNSDGTATSYSTYTDLTNQLELQKRLSDIIQTVPSGIALFRWNGGDLKPVVVNARLSEMLGEDAMEYLRSAENFNYTHVHPDDIEAVKAATLNGLNNTGTADHIYRTLNSKTGKYLWIHMRGRALPQPDGSKYIYVSYADVTQEHENAQKLRESEKLLEYATELNGLWCWRYDPAHDRAYMDVNNQREFDIPAVVENFPDSWLEKGHVAPEHVQAYRDAFASIKNGAKRAEFEARVIMKDAKIHWTRICLSALAGDDGENIAICVANMIDDEKELMAKYEFEKNKALVNEENLIAHALFDLTTGKTLEYAYCDGTPVPEENRIALTGREKNINLLLIDDGERRQLRQFNDIPYMLERYEQGETEFTLDYRCRTGFGEIVWVRNTMRMMRDPGSGDVLLFISMTNVEEAKMRDIMYRSLAEDNYDFAARIDGRTGRFVTYPRAGLEYRVPPLRGDRFDDVASRILKDNGVHPDDIQASYSNALLANMSKNVRTHGRYSYNYRELQPDGTLRYKKITQYYIDPQREIIVMTREDVTSIIKDETEKNEILASALEASKQAGVAKSQFLSRMSHELRTPMNAIIGLSVLAADDINNPAAMENAISKIGLSARYLLSLINDILEMSRIESGRMSLNESEFDFARLLSNVNTIIYKQCCDKDIEYDAIVRGCTEASYIGDSVKLQQVLINVLGNSVKFTPPGGRITLGAEQVRLDGKRALLRFTIADTGVGIDKEFIPKLFEMFTQEEGGFTSTANGTGLGLAIAKNIVELMDGNIDVQSAKNEGSVFTIDVKLGLCDSRPAGPSEEVLQKLGSLKALIVDDDITVCKATELILASIGLRAEWVDSGKKAVQRVFAAKEACRHYDLIFIDWKMPDMDGIETARQIRKLAGPDVTIIIMTAYDWKLIESQARQVGVDIFIDKPLVQTSVINVFEKLFSQNHCTSEEAADDDYDFTGRHMLLVEDHPLNIEVARQILERTGAKVTVARNGKESVDAFFQSEEGSYDAVLMDIRMPVMDGLTAARAIRSLDRPDARKVPIIAMTANAFDEDVKRSLYHGMDAHLIKPIEPQTMYAMLKKLMKKR